MADKRKAALEARLDPRQIKAALLCVEREFTPEAERRTFDDIAEEIGVTRKTIHQWRTQKRAFIDYVNYLADEHLESYRSYVYAQLMKTIGGAQPSVKGIDLYFRRHGLITQQVAVETKDAAATKSNDELAQDIAELDELIAEADADANGGGDGADA